MHIKDFKDTTIHFSGIGGISMSGLAKMLHHAGYRVTGSDQKDSAALDALRALGIPCATGHQPEFVDGCGLVVRTAAIHDDNPEIQRAHTLGIPVMERGTLLGQIMQSYREVICVSGAHGKTTTSSMIATILELAGKDPTIHLGGSLPLIGDASKVGGRNLFVAEACEYKDSFLQFYPTLSVLLNIDADHLDYFKNIEAIEKSFTRFVERTPASGLVIGNGGDSRVMRVMSKARCPVETFGYGPEDTWQAVNPQQNHGVYHFTLLYRGKKAADVSLSVMGEHNVLNASAAIAAAHHCGVDPQQAADLLKGFTGANRRFEKAGDYFSANVYHDYAHHPTEIRATLKAARQLAEKKLYCVFQPHTYSRTKALFDEFVQSFDMVDGLVLLDIYAARETNPGDISASMLVDAIAKRGVSVRYAASFEQAADLVHQWAKPGDVIITLGAGDIEKMSRLLVSP
jgi:UDP-N-acetylmuramate--alanine ligase